MVEGSLNEALQQGDQKGRIRYIAQATYHHVTKYCIVQKSCSAKLRTWTVSIHPRRVHCQAGDSERALWKQRMACLCRNSMVGMSQRIVDGPQEDQQLIDVNRRHFVANRRRIKVSGGEKSSTAGQSKSALPNFSAARKSHIAKSSKSIFRFSSFFPRQFHRQRSRPTEF